MSRRTFALTGLLFAVVIFLVLQNSARAMTSTNYLINWDSVNSGGDDVSSSTNFGLRDTLGEQATGYSSSTSYLVSAGYRVGDQDIPSLTFIIGTQENSTKTAYTAFSTSSKSVIVASTAGYSNNDLIGVVENIGLAQMVAIGKIVSILGTTITVDAWEGTPQLMSEVPGVGNNSVFRMNGYAAELGTLSTTAGNTSITGTRIESDAPNGYTVYVNDDGDLRNGTTPITNVSDGSVTVGSEEYGIRIFGSHAVGVGSDIALSTSPQTIQQSSTSTQSEERDVIVYKAAISSATTAGNYSQNVFYTVTANY